jgi:hypothetical protein
MCHGVSRPFWILGLRLFWNQLEPALSDPKEVLKVLSQRKDVYQIIMTPEGIRWLNYFCGQMYFFLRLYTYGGSCIICAQPLDACSDPWLKLSTPGAYVHTRCWEAWTQWMTSHAT